MTSILSLVLGLVFWALYAVPWDLMRRFFPGCMGGLGFLIALAAGAAVGALLALFALIKGPLRVLAVLGLVANLAMIVTVLLTSGFLKP